MYSTAGVTVYVMAIGVLIGSSFNVGRLLGIDRFGHIHFVADSDGLLIIYLDEMDEGTRLSLEYAKANHKPIYIIKANEEPGTKEFISWIELNGIIYLNIAGPRESNGDTGSALA